MIGSDLPPSHAIRRVRTMCPMNCHPTYCGMELEIQDDRVLSIRGDAENPDSRGFLCIRGQASREVIDNPMRVLRPRLRDVRTDDAWRDTSWDEALDRIAAAVGKVGPEAVAVWAGHGIIVNSVGRRLAPRFANLCGFQWWEPAIVCWGLGGFGMSLTGPVQVNTKEDMAAHSDLIVLWGANLASQPTTAPHLVAAKRRGAWIVAIDVRRSEAFEQAHETHLIRPGTDAALALALMHVIVGEGLHDPVFVSSHTTGFPELTAHVKQYTPEWAETETGVPATAIRALARRYAATKQSMILVGGSSMHKSANGWQAGRALARMDLVVSHDLFMQETARNHSDVVLPATSWLEETGYKTTNTHLYLMDQVISARGDARPAAWVLDALARRFGVDDFFPWMDMDGLLTDLFDHPAMGHVTPARLRAHDGRQALAVSHVAHPDLRFPTPSHKVEFFSERAVQLGLAPLPVYEPIAEDAARQPERATRYPLLFRQGRTLTHFHGFYDHGRALPTLAKADPGPRLWINPADAAARRVGENDAIRVFNDRGTMAARAQVTDRVPPGVVWMRDGWAGINDLTSGVRSLPAAAAQAFPGGQAAYEARVEVSPEDL